MNEKRWNKTDMNSNTINITSTFPVSVNVAIAFAADAAALLHLLFFATVAVSVGVYGD